MDLEAVIVMVVGLAALATLRLMLAVIGRDFDADHPGSGVPPAADDAPDAGGRAAVHRGTGRQRHLLYFEPADEPGRTGVPADRPAVRFPRAS